MLELYTNSTHRDDLTVQVIFFGEGDNNGQAVLNQEASAATTRETRPKL